MQRHGIVDLRSHTTLRKKGPQAVAITRAHHILMIDVSCPGPGLQQCDRCRGFSPGHYQPGMMEQAVIDARPLLALSIPLLQMRHLYPQCGGLDRIQPAVGPAFMMVITLLAAMIA